MEIASTLLLLLLHFLVSYMFFRMFYELCRDKDEGWIVSAAFCLIIGVLLQVMTISFFLEKQTNQIIIIYPNADYRRE